MNATPRWRLEKRYGQLPILPGAMFLALFKDFRREHLVDAEQLELHRSAPDVGCAVDEGEGAIEVAVMI
jgi:hypothetical protein